MEIVIKYNYISYNSNIKDVIALRSVDMLIRRPFLSIYKCPDEWYFIISEGGPNKYRGYWKCDQLDGLEKLLKDIENSL